MQFEWRSRRWALVASGTIHALLWGALMLALQRHAPPQEAGALLQVRVVAAPTPRAKVEPATAAAVTATAGVATPAATPVREDIRYYEPEELERQLILLRDRSADDGLAVLHAVVMQLFVDQGGRVVLIRFEGTPPPQAEQQRLRAAFMTLEFLPALRHGQAVPARIRIALERDAELANGANADAQALR